MMVVNIDNETCHLSLLSGPIKKSILSFPVHDGQKCIICFWDKTIRFSPAVRQIISAQERTLSWIFHRQHIISYTMHAVYYFIYQARQYIISNTKDAVYYFIITYLPDNLQSFNRSSHRDTFSLDSTYVDMSNFASFDKVYFSSPPECPPLTIFFKICWRNLTL